MVRFKETAALSLDTEIRFHLATDLHQYVDQLLLGASPDANTTLAEKLEADGYHLRITDNMETAAAYLKERYDEHSEARYGLVASSKDQI